MKHSTVFALGALLASVAANPLVHRHLHEKKALAKRQDVVTTTITTDITETVDVTVTVAGSPPTDSPHELAVEISPSTTVVASAATSSPAVVSPSSPENPPVKEEVKHVQPQPQAPAPTTTSTFTAPTVTPPAPTSTAPAPTVAPPAPTTTSAAPATVASQAPATGGSDGGATGGACGTVGGSCSGDLTVYSGGGGACGWTNDTASEMFFALPHAMMGDNVSNDAPGIHKNTYCGRMASITANGKTTTAMVTDKCGGCQGESIDASLQLFQFFYPGQTTGRYHADWKMVTEAIYQSPPADGCGGNGESPC